MREPGPLGDPRSEGAAGAGAAVSNEVSGRVLFSTVIQGRDIEVHLPPRITPALSGLPSVSPAFTGRDRQVEELLALLAPGKERSQAVLVGAVAGLAGVGKTELAVQTAARALEQPGWFPGGVLFVDMFGYDPERRVSPERALGSLLRALGMHGQDIPAELPDRSRLYRSVLAAFAEQNRRILVVIDNVSTAEQARPLLPTDGATGALLTSRHTVDIDARLHDLDVLGEDASVELLRQALRQARGPVDTRVEDAPEHATAIARLCGGLPLALRIAAALLADAPTRPLASLAQALEATQPRLDRLRREDRGVRAAFDLSYQHLGDDHARLFRLLPLNVGPDLSTESAAQLAGADRVRTEELLQDLARAHLIEHGRTWGRWRLHDLVRLYATELGHQQARADARDAAEHRLHRHYVATARAARSNLALAVETAWRLGDVSPREWRALRPRNDAQGDRAREQSLELGLEQSLELSLVREPRSALFAGVDAAEEWFDEECSNLIALITAAPASGRAATAVQLAAFLTPFLRWEYRFRELRTIVATVKGLARQRADAPSQLGTALLMISFELDRVDYTMDAIDLLVDAVEFLCECDKRAEEAVAMREIRHHLFKIIRRGALSKTCTLRLRQLVLAHAHFVDPEHKEVIDHRQECWCRRCWLSRIKTANWNVQRRSHDSLHIFGLPETLP